MRRQLFAALVTLSAGLSNAQGYCATSYKVANCSLCGSNGTSSLPGECREIKDVSDTVDCMCLRPNFAYDGECVQGIKIIGYVDKTTRLSRLGTQILLYCVYEFKNVIAIEAIFIVFPYIQLTTHAVQMGVVDPIACHRIRFWSL